MFLWVLQISISSLLFICIVHYLMDYLKNTFTVPKRVATTMDEEKYEKIYHLMRETNQYPVQVQDLVHEQNPSQVTSLDQLPPVVEMENDANMKEELKQFLKQMDY